jgi:hypothetical protein
VTEILLPIVLFTVPVLVIVLLATAFGRRLKGSCGGMAPDGTCSRCGRTAEEMPPAGRTGGCAS